MSDKWDIELSNMFWTQLLDDNHTACYDHLIDFSVMRILEYIIIKCDNNECTYYTSISEDLKLDPMFVQMIQYLLCAKDFTEYGSSPRGCWIIQKGREFFNQYKEAWDKSK